MESLKNYRNNELKWFLVANVLLMILTSKSFEFKEGDLLNQVIINIEKIISISIFSTTIYVFTFIIDSIIPSNLKVFLVFLWKKKPSATIFTQIQKNCKDDRFNIEEAKTKYKNIYIKIEKENQFSKDQTPLWYEIYNKYRDNSIVYGSNRDYLLLRDLHSQVIVLIITYITLILTTGIILFSINYLIYLFVILIVLNIGARIQGKRMVYTVIALDLNESKNTEKKKGEI